MTSWVGIICCTVALSMNFYQSMQDLSIKMLFAYDVHIFHWGIENGTFSCLMFVLLLICYSIFPRTPISVSRYFLHHILTDCHFRINSPHNSLNSYVGYGYLIPAFLSICLSKSISLSLIVIDLPCWVLLMICFMAQVCYLSCIMSLLIRISWFSP